jgi:hypothetical protein
MRSQQMQGINFAAGRGEGFGNHNFYSLCVKPNPFRQGAAVNHPDFVQETFSYFLG